MASKSLEKQKIQIGLREQEACDLMISMACAMFSASTNWQSNVINGMV